MLKQYETLRVPVVLADQPGEAYALHSISAANYKAAFYATARIIEKGHRQLAFVRSVVSNIKNIDPDAKERQEGFTAACKRAGLKAGQYRIVSATFDPRSAAIGELFESRPRITAVLCAGITHAGQIEAEARVRVIPIPRELSVATFRDPGVFAPDWSGAEIVFVAMGGAAVDLLRGRPRKRTHIRLPAV